MRSTTTRPRALSSSEPGRPAPPGGCVGFFYTTEIDEIGESFFLAAVLIFREEGIRAIYSRLEKWGA